MIRALLGMKEVMETMKEAIERSTQSVVLVGSVVSGASTSLQDLPEKISKVVRSAIVEREDKEAAREQRAGVQQERKNKTHCNELGSAEAECPQENQSIGSCHADVYSLQSAYRIYSKSMEPLKVSRPGDPKFFAARKAWKRLCQDFPVQQGCHRRLLACAFSGTALAIFEDVTSTHLDADANTLWETLQGRLCSSSHQRSLRIGFDTMEWEEGRETIGQFAQRLRTAAVALPDAVSDERLLDRFTQSPSGRLRDHALAVQGTFDEVASRVAMMGPKRAVSGRESRFRSERVAVLTGGNAMEHDKSPQGLSPALSPSATEGRFATATCYYCGIKGHLARSCEKKHRDKSQREMRTAGEAGRDGNAAGAPPAKRN